MRLHLYYVYILTSSNHTVLYTGVTNDLERRCFEYKQKKITLIDKFNPAWENLYQNGKIKIPEDQE
jgi:predicted GIY-YIG superfamily endonuclease